MKPLIEDVTTRGLIQRTVMHIAGAVARREAQTPFEIADHALLRSYLASDAVFPDPEDKAGRLLADSIRKFNGSAALGLDSGGARIGWTIAHLASDETANDRCARLDEMLMRATENWIGELDLMNGLVGFGVYALERGEAGRPLALHVLALLERSAISHGDRIAWFTPADLLPPNHAGRTRDGYWNLGIPHGVPGVIALLSRYIAEGVEVERARALLDGAVRFMLSVAAIGPAHGRFPPWLPNDKPISSRLAWCYGDLGIATALVGAGVLAREPAWQREGIALAHACAARTLEQAHIRDAGICHGAAGIAHMLHRMARATQDESLRTAACAWIVETIRMQSDAPIAGFPRVFEVAGELQFEEDATLLTGCVGVALVLHAAISEVEPKWDRLLMLDLPI
ncbi:MAG: lanthionine synthetase C family protein [Myxococcota bacterium]|nr:lanthionine synthetase C family protein [Myxococcota bacterium]